MSLNIFRQCYQLSYKDRAHASFLLKAKALSEDFQLQFLAESIADYRLRLLEYD